MRSEVADVTGNVRYISKSVFLTVQANVHDKAMFAFRSDRKRYPV